MPKGKVHLLRVVGDTVTACGRRITSERPSTVTPDLSGVSCPRCAARAVPPLAKPVPKNAVRPNYPIPERVARRAAESYKIDAATGCWLSTRMRNPLGYAAIEWKEGDERRSTLVHRAAWTHANGPIPDGMTIDHMCKQKACVNPYHLRLLTLSDNSARRGHRDWAIGTCVNGHPASMRRESVWANRQVSYCGPCLDEKNARARAARKARALASAEDAAPE
jgi:hypothetical protein